jgi:hypothetical protein
MEEPTMEEPTMEEPTMEEPTMEEPTMEEPTMKEPTMKEPIMEEPTMEESVQENISFAIELESIPSKIVPKIVFIVPYRDRPEHLAYFKIHMITILEDMNPTEYKILYIHQKDNRTFNRGAMKNIGFLYVKQIYPDAYKTITLVFNDVDTMPQTKNLLNYQTTSGVVKHFYGYTFTLGGIVSIMAEDFENTNGFPNYWAWGYEDNAFQKRVISRGLHIDRSQFYKILDKNILHFNDTLERIVNRKEFERYMNEYKYSNTNDGIITIWNLSYSENNNFVNVSNFRTSVEDHPDTNTIHNLQNGAVPFRIKKRRTCGMRMVL